MEAHAGIAAFARSITVETLLGLVFHRPEPNATPMRCFENVWAKVRRDGGIARYGWTFLYRVVPEIPNARYLSATHHAVWQPAGSGQLVDVTPFHTDRRHWPVTEDGDVLFLFDESAQPVVTEKVIAPRPSRYFALGSDERLIQHVEELRRNEEQECGEIYGYMA